LVRDFTSINYLASQLQFMSGKNLGNSLKFTSKLALFSKATAANNHIAYD